MNWLEGIRIALTALRANKMRSTLTCLGVIIGVGAVIAMTALGQGARRDVEARISQMGSNLLFVAPGQAGSGPIFRAFGSADTLTVEDAEAIRDQLPTVAGVAPELSKNLQVKFGSNNGNFNVVGTFPEHAAVRKLEIADGRFFNALEYEARRRVVILGASVVTTLFPNGEKPVGKRIKLGNVPFTVIGYLAERGGFGREDQALYIPLAVMRQRFEGKKYVRYIAVGGQDGVPLATVEKDVRHLLRRRHRLRPGVQDDFSIQSQQDILAAQQESSRIFTMLLAGIASISLIVGGIGIMNIMLVTVTERTREIGIRKALGARRRDIQLQFLIESCVLSIFGGGLGIALGLGAAKYIAHKGISVFVAPDAVLMAFGCAAGIGIFFGYYPASQAGKLDPIEALRYE